MFDSYLCPNVGERLLHPSLLYRLILGGIYDDYESLVPLGCTRLRVEPLARDLRITSNRVGPLTL
jgi:hypothetical protein